MDYKAVRLGSVFLAYGDEGTAYQRFYSDGLYHGTNGAVLSEEEFSLLPNITLIHAPMKDY